MEVSFDTSLDELFTELAIRPATRNLVEALIWDLPLTPAGIVDFGVDSDNHYRALRAALLDDPVDEEEAHDSEKTIAELRKRIVELDAALGKGPALTALVQRYAPVYADVVQFHTSWDELSFEQTERKPKSGSR